MGDVKEKLRPSQHKDESTTKSSKSKVQSTPSTNTNYNIKELRGNNLKASSIG